MPINNPPDLTEYLDKPTYDSDKDGIFGLAVLPKGTDDYVIKGTGAGTIPAYEALTISVTEILALSSNVFSGSSGWQVVRTCNIPSDAERVNAMAVARSNGLGTRTIGCRIVYKGVSKSSHTTETVSNCRHTQAAWEGPAEGGGTLTIQCYSSVEYPTTSDKIISKAMHMKIS